MRISITFALLLVLLASACPPRNIEPTPAPSDPTPSPAGRVAAIALDHPLYGRVEGEGIANDCTDDAGCFLGGCSSEVCSAQSGLTTTCESTEGFPPGPGPQCGCVRNQCIWYRVTEGEPEAQPQPPQLGETCGAGGACAAGLACLEYFGIAGPSGPMFTSCEFRCSPDGAGCPSGHACVTISDGPGQVCRPDP